jgi:hypothetical protein
MLTCGQEFITKDCGCLADPMDPWSTVCGYVNRQNGLVYPCDPGCCNPVCTNVGKSPKFGVEYRKSAGTTLPEGFNVNLATSDEPSPPAGGAVPIDSIGQSPNPLRKKDIEVTFEDGPALIDRKWFRKFAWLLFLLFVILVISVGIL